ncbi:hypothetical protein GCM10009582_26860 [Arthrobacter flavus]
MTAAPKLSGVDMYGNTAASISASSAPTGSASKSHTTTEIPSGAGCSASSISTLGTDTVLILSIPKA